MSLALDFTPNPAHAPLYMAVAGGLDRRFGIRLHIHAPGSGPDSLGLLLAGRVDISVLDIDDLGLAAEKGADIVGVAALVQQPLGAIVAQPYIQRPRQLMGRRVGVSGLPSDPAFLRAVVSRDGGDPTRLNEVTIGFNAVADMAAGAIAAVPAFWSDEAVALRRHGLRVNVFRVDRYGAPEFPELVLAVRREMLATRPAVIVRTLAAIAAGAEAVRRDPLQAAQLITAASGSADPGLIRAQTRVILPALFPPLTLNLRALLGWADFSAANRLLPRRLDVRRSFDPALAAPALRLAAER